jgi:hypothetical protein
MRRTALVLLALAMLAGTGMAQELNFGKYGIGVGFGSQYFFLNTWSPFVRMSGTRTVWVGSTGITSNWYEDFWPQPVEQAVATNIPFDVTWRPIENLGVRAGASYQMGGMNYKSTETINDADVDTMGNFETTIRDQGSEAFDIKNKISGFPFAFSVVPAFKLGDRVLLQPEAGVAYYSMSIKGDRGTYSFNVTTTTTVRDMVNNTSTTTTTRTAISTSGMSPDVKYTGLGSFWGFDTQVLVHKNVAVRAGFRKGGATLKEKWEDRIDRLYDRGGQRWERFNDSTTYENSLHIATEAYNLGLVYNF